MIRPGNRAKSTTVCGVIFTTFMLFIVPFASHFSITFETEAEDPITTITGSGQDNHLGWNVSNAGDVNGDGYNDIIAGTPGYDNNRGRAYIFFGGPWLSGDLTIEEANVTLTGNTQGDEFGWDVSDAGDINGDGFYDVIVGAPGNNSDKGAAYVFYGGEIPSWNVSFFAALANVTITGENPGGKLGFSVSGAGDIDGDGMDDIIIGAPGSDMNSGKAYLFHRIVDGYNDVVIANYGDDTVTIYNGTRKGWETKATLDVGNAPQSVFVGDANNDGLNDIVTADRLDNTVSILRGKSNGGWETRTIKAVGAAPVNVHIGDANNDDLNDILTANYGANTVTLFNGTGSGGWEAATIFSTALGPYSVTVGDANNDGLNDILTGNYDSDTITLYNGTMGGVWESASTFNSGDGSESIFVEDANNDGLNDMLTADEIDNTISIFNGTSDNNWEPRFAMSTGNTPYDIFVEDANNDGLSDIVSVDSGDNTLSVFNWTVAGSWDQRYSLGVGSTPKDLFVGDANNDGLNDLLSGDTQSNTISIYKGTNNHLWGEKCTLSSGNSPRGIFLANANNDKGDRFLNATDADLILEGNASGDKFGYSVSSAGDMNGDGYDDVIVGAPGQEMSHIYLGGENMGSVNNSKAATIGPPDTTTGQDISSLQADDELSYVVAKDQVMFVDSFNVTGINSLTGAVLSVKYRTGSKYDGTNNVRWALEGQAPADTDINIILSTQNITRRFDLFSLGADTLDEIANLNISFTSNCGNGADKEVFFDHVWIEVTTRIGKTILTLSGSGDFGWSVSHVGDLNGDDIADVIIGAPDSTSGTNPGQVHIKHGNSQNFNNEPTESMPAGWTWAGSGGGPEAVVDETIYYGSGGKSVRINNSATNEYSGIKKTVTSSSEGILDLYARTSHLPGTEDFRIKIGSGGVTTGTEACYIALGCANTPYDYISYYDGNGSGGFTRVHIQPYTTDTWYNLRIVFDCSSNTYDIYIDGALMVTGAGFINNASTLDTIGLVQNYISFIRTAYVDNVVWLTPTIDSTITGESNGDQFGYSVSSAGDVNGDGYDDLLVGAPMSGGDLDIVSCGNDNEVTFHSNTNGDGSTWSPTNVHTDTNFVYSVAIGDIDGDDDLDIVSGGENNKVIFQNNTLGDGSAWSQVDVHTDTSSINSVAIGDIDGDGDLDIASGGENKMIFFHNNTNGDGSSWFSFLVYNDVQGASSVSLGDIDNDGDLDIVSCINKKVYFHNNTNGDGSAWSEILVYSDSFFLESSALGDMDGDGDLDIVSGGFNKDVIFHDNTNGDGSSWTNNVIYTSPQAVMSVDIWDLDGDGDLDIASGDRNNEVLFHNNTNGDGSFWTQITVFTAGSFVYSVAIGDIDYDGDPDIISGDMANEVIFHNNTNGDGSSWSQIGVYTATGFVNAVAIGDIDGDGRGIGKSYIYYGSTTFDNIPDIILKGEAAGDNFGHSVSSAGNLDSDIEDEIIIGAPYYDDGADTDAGKAYIYYYSSTLGSIYQPDMWINGSVDDLYMDIPVGEQVDIKIISAGDNATWWIVLQNDGDDNDTFNFNITTSMLPGWTWELKDNATWNLINDGDWISLNIGEWKNYTLNISSPVTAVNNDESWVEIITKSQNGSTYDSVKAIARILGSDIIPPEITDTTPGIPTTGDTFTITATVTDDVSVDEVHLYYWFDLYGGGTDGPYNLTMDPTYTKDINVPINATSLHYNISANDTSNNWNETGEIVLGVNDNNPPQITDITSGNPSTNATFTISATVTDNIGVGDAFVYYWFETTGGPTAPTNFSMNDLGGGNYDYVIDIPSNGLVLHYNISANDTSNIWNQTGDIVLNIQDNVPPEITDTTSGTPTTGDIFTINATVIDNIGVDEVHLYYWFDLYGGGTDGPYNVTMDPSYTKDINVPVNATSLHYNISANDTSNNWNESGVTTIGVMDNDPPEITDTTLGTPQPSNPFIINVTVMDNINVSDVHLYFWFNTSGGPTLPQNVSMIDLGGGNYNYTINVPATAFVLYYNISSNDTSNNWNETKEIIVVIQDGIKPDIIDTTSNILTTGDLFNITAFITDNIQLGEVHLYFWFDTIGGPSAPQNTTMNNLGGGNYDCWISIPSNALLIHYNISANDSSNNWNETKDTITMVLDNDPPEIADNTVGVPTTGETFNITATVSENIGMGDVFLYYWFDTTGGSTIAVNVSMKDLGGGDYDYLIVVPSNALLLHYNISANDTSNNWNETGVININVVDNDSPQILDKTAGNPLTGENFTISATVTDNIDVKGVNLYYWFNTTSGPISPINVSMNDLGGGNYDYLIDVPLNAISLHYNISANDTSHNWNETGQKDISVFDLVKPNIIDITLGTPTTGDNFTINAIVTDNVAVKDVFLYYWVDLYGGGTDGPYNVTMAPGYSKNITIPSNAVMLHYYISTCDTNDNWNETAQDDIIVIDNDLPIIIDTTTGIPQPGNLFTINATVLDNINVSNVSLYYWFDTTGGLTSPQEVIMKDLGGGNYDYIISVPATAIVLYYNISANDTYKNLNETGPIKIVILDDIPPKIIDNTLGVPTTGESFLIKAMITDNIEVDRVFIYYWIDTTFGSTVPINISMKDQGGGNYDYLIDIPVNAIMLHYRISSNDTSDNWNETGLVNIAVIDNDIPEITDTTVGIPITGGAFTITATITDNIQVDTIHIYYWFDTTGASIAPLNVTMIDLGGGNYEYVINIPSNGRTLYYNISANDTSNNWNETGLNIVDIQDKLLPEIIDTTIGIPYTDEVFTISAFIVDNILVGSVHLYYWFETVLGPTIPQNFTMSNIGGGNYDYLIIIPSDALILHYNISANDTSNNWNEIGEILLTIYDNDIPEINDTTVGVPTTNETFTITASVNDNIGVDGVHLYYWLDLYGGGTDGPYNVTMNLGYTININIPSNAITLHYNISANDTSNNWNETGVITLGVVDNDSPIITDTTIGSPTTGDTFTITSAITDNIAVDYVCVYYWFDLYSGGTNGPYNVSMNLGYTADINVPFNATILHYNISANDTSNNWNETGVITHGVMDNDSPIITDTTLGIPTTGVIFAITLKITDNLDVGEAHIYFWLDTVGGLTLATNLTMNDLGGGNYDYSLSIPSDALVLHYNLSANDTANNWNQTGEVVITVVDNDPPTITDTTIDIPNTGEIFGITATVTDNIGVHGVYLYYWLETTMGPTFPQNISMIDLGGGNYEYIIDTPSNSFLLHYNISANDTSNNWNETGITTLDVNDNDSPQINGVSVEPRFQIPGGYVNVSVNITDEVGVNEVWLNITYPDGNWTNVSMKKGEDNYWYLNNTYIEQGDYIFIIYANDSNSNLNMTPPSGFTINSPEVDYIQIRTEPNDGGQVVSNMVYYLNDVDCYYASAYNNTYGYLGEVEVSWMSSNDNAGGIDPDFGTNTTFTAIGQGYGTVYALYLGIQNSTDYGVLAPQLPEIIGTIPDVALDEDFGLYQLVLSPYAYDPQDSIPDLKWFLTGVNTSILTTGGENLTGNHIITLVSKNDMHGRMQVTYWLVDGEGNFASQKAWINVSPENDPPSISECPDLFVHYDNPYSFDYSPYIHDVDNDISELTLICDDVSHSSVDELIVTYTYPESMLNESVFIVLTVSDEIGSGSDLIIITITSDYPPVTVDKIPDVFLNESETKLGYFDLDNYIMDPDGDSLYMSYGHTHVNITIHDNHVVDFSASGEWSGMERVTFRAEDPTGAIVEQTINVTVIPVNDPPVIKPLTNLMVHFDYDYIFDLLWYISDNDNTIEELTIYTSNPDNVTVDGTRIILNYPGYWEGQRYRYTVPLTIYVTDGIDTAFQVISVIVDDDYPPRILKTMDDLTFNEDEVLVGAYDLDDFFEDVDSDTLIYSSGHLNINVTIYEDHTVDFSATTNWFGSELITVRAEDDEGAFAEDVILVTVLPVNDPPTIADIPLQIGEKGMIWSLDLKGYISDVDDELDDLTIFVDSPYINVVGLVLVFIYPENITQDTFQVTVSDGEYDAKSPIEVSIKEIPRIAPKGESFPWILLLMIVLSTLLATLLVLRRGIYIVEDLFLIARSGLLISHAGTTKSYEKDEEILASMFIAVQEFVRDSFSGEEGVSLKRMDYGDTKVLIFKGDHVNLSAFLSGPIIKPFYKKMEDFVEDAQERYKGKIENWRGDHDDFPEIDLMLNSLLEGSYTKGHWEKQDK